MSHFAKVFDGIVQEVLVIDQDVIDTGLFGSPNNFVQTSYNTLGGIHYGNDNQPDGGIALRKNYAGIGYTYDKIRDAFIPPRQFSTWILNEDTCFWEPPIPYPDDGKAYIWDNVEIRWELI